MPNYIKTIQFGDLNYHVEKDGREYRLWLNGCRIGRPRPDKPAGEVREYRATQLSEACATVHTDAEERLTRKAKALRGEMQEIQMLLGRIEKAANRPRGVEPEGE